MSVPPSYKGHRYPVEIISHCVWLYFRFPLSFREVEELMLERDVIVSYETVRRWCLKFGQRYANGLRRRQAFTTSRSAADRAPRGRTSGTSDESVTGRKIKLGFCVVCAPEIRTSQ